MRISISFPRLVSGLLPLLLVIVSGCGDSNNTPGNPAGDWNIVAIENVTQGTRVDCPGVSGELECGTATLSLAEAGTLTIVETTDEMGAPDDYRHEGIWRTEGDRLTLVLSAGGTDADNLEPIDPPDEVSGTYTVSSDTLTWSDTDESGDTLTSSYRRL